MARLLTIIFPRATSAEAEATNNVASPQGKGKGKAPADESMEEEEEEEEEDDDEEEEDDEEEVRFQSRRVPAPPFFIPKKNARRVLVPPLDATLFIPFILPPNPAAIILTTSGTIFKHMGLTHLFFYRAKKTSRRSTRLRSSPPADAPAASKSTTPPRRP